MAKRDGHRGPDIEHIRDAMREHDERQDETDEQEEREEREDQRSPPMPSDPPASDDTGGTD